MEIGMMMMNGGERGRENGRELTVNFETEPHEQVEADREVFGGLGGGVTSCFLPCCLCFYRVPSPPSLSPALVLVYGGATSNNLAGNSRVV